MKKMLNVIMVEDSEDDARLLVRELTRADYQVSYERVETAEALKRALAQDQWQVILCDFTMPRFSGKAALHIVREAGLDLPFIYVSGTIGEDVAVEAMKAGAHDYVMKNNLNRLAPAVERELGEAEVRKRNRLLESDRQRLIEDLQAALAEVKQLSGLLRVCAGCKQIHKPDGTWQTIESYIMEHSEATFTHGLCPKCITRLYPDAADEILKSLP